MFSDFDKNKKSDDEGGGRRMGVSLAISALVYGLIAAGIIAAVATARAVVRQQEEDVAVEFALKAEEKPKVEEKPKPKPVEKKEPEAPKVKQEGQVRGLDAPTSIPDEQLQEASSGQLAVAEEINIDEMIGQGGTGKEKTKGPRQHTEKVSRPKFAGGCRAPEVPIEVRKSAETIRVRVRILVMPDGKPAKAEMDQSHPSIPDQVIIDCALAQLFEPARLPDGTPVPYPYLRQFTFKPANI